MWLRGYEVLPPAGTDSRTRALTQKASPRSGRFTEVDGCSTIFSRTTRIFPLLLEMSFQLGFPNTKRSCKLLWVVKRHDHVLMDF